MYILANRQLFTTCSIRSSKYETLPQSCRDELVSISLFGSKSTNQQASAQARADYDVSVKLQHKLHFFCSANSITTSSSRSRIKKQSVWWHDEQRISAEKINHGIQQWHRFNQEV